MTKERFEELVNEGTGAIPKKFLEKLDNVDIVIEDEPTPYQLRKKKLKKSLRRQFSMKLLTILEWMKKG